MTKWQKVALVLLPAAALLSSVFLFTPKASALTTPPIEHTQTGFAQWNWPALIKTNQPGHGGGHCTGSCSPLPISHFNPETSSYVIFHVPSQEWLVPYNPFGKTVTLSVWRLAIAPEGRSLTLKKDVVTGNYLIGVDTGTFQLVDLLDYNGEQVTAGGNTFYGRVQPVPPPFSVSSVGDIEYIYAAKNVIYHGTWDAGVYNSFVDYGADSGQSCSAVDVGCWISKAWSGVANTVSSVGRAIVETFARFFIPSGSEISERFDEFNDFLVAKLGFLTYPFTFLVDVFNAFTADNTFACNESSCVKTFGSFLTGMFTLDFALLAREFPTLWDWLKAMVVGLTILEIVIVIRRKVMGVIHR